MRKIITPLLLLVILLYSCKKEEIKVEKKSKFFKLDEYRKIYTGVDSLTLKPFELFEVMKLNTSFNEMDETQTISLRGNDFNFEVLNGLKNKIKIRGNTVSLNLEYYKGYSNRKKYFNREIEIGGNYKVIFGYKINELQNRYPFASEMFDSGYYIIDILPLNEKFPRQKGAITSSNNNLVNTPQPIKENKDYCSLSRNETSNYVIKSSPFTLGSSGRVSFTNSGQITLLGNGKTLYGTWDVSSSNAIRIKDLKVISGNFDPTNNYGVNGYLIIDCNGNVSGDLYDRNRNKTSLNLKK